MQFFRQRWWDHEDGQDVGALTRNRSGLSRRLDPLTRAEQGVSTLFRLLVPLRTSMRGGLGTIAAICDNRPALHEANGGIAPMPV